MIQFTQRVHRHKNERILCPHRPMAGGCAPPPRTLLVWVCDVEPMSWNLRPHVGKVTVTAGQYDFERNHMGFVQ